jgi:hypothetical protein
MQTAITVALISALVAVSSAAFTFWGQVKLKRLSSEIDTLQERERERRDAAKVSRKYHEPLARSAYDFQSRLYNMLAKDFAGRYLERGNEREQDYAVYNTVFLVAQYFAWTEIIRIAIQYVDLGSDDQTRQFARLQDKIFALFTTDRFPAAFRVFAGEQRALGEWMIRQTEAGPECVGYGTFVERMRGDKETDPIAKYLAADVKRFAIDTARPRLVEVQNALIDLLDFLDPGYVRFDKLNRTKVPAA